MGPMRQPQLGGDTEPEVDIDPEAHVTTSLILDGRLPAPEAEPPVWESSRVLGLQPPGVRGSERGSKSLCAKTVIGISAGTVAVVFLAAFILVLPASAGLEASDPVASNPLGRSAGPSWGRSALDVHRVPKSAGIKGIPRAEVRNAIHEMSLVIDMLENVARRCEDDEELFDGLCYKRCSLLTDGRFPERWAPNACSRDDSDKGDGESTIASKGGNCSGYGVGGSRLCPHRPFPGECEDNEEPFLGFCYKRCSLLTEGTHPIRKSMNTCCQQEPCNSLAVFKSAGVGCEGYGVGGGVDGHECAHLPERRPKKPTEKDEGRRMKPDNWP